MNGHTIREVATAATARQPEQSTGTLKIFSNSAMSANTLRGRLYGFKIFKDGVEVRGAAANGGAIAAVATRARLGSGVHTIRISNATAWTPDIDRMTVVLALADSASCGK